jgi:hypothetical protein
MSYENILTKTENGILTITVNRPDKLNALNKKTIEEIGAAVSAGEKDAAVKIIIITGAVSEETVRAMVSGVIVSMETDFAIATSGIMGPDGGTEKKPVGTVWIAAGNAREIITQKLWFRFDRQRNIELTAANVLNLLRKFILSQPPDDVLKDLNN